jgi:hypothetical protein
VDLAGGYGVPDLKQVLIFTGQVSELTLRPLDDATTWGNMPEHCLDGRPDPVPLGGRLSTAETLGPLIASATDDHSIDGSPEVAPAQ